MFPNTVVDFKAKQASTGIGIDLCSLKKIVCQKIGTHVE